MPDNKCRWKSKSIPDCECHEPPLPNDTHCILHSEKDDKDIEQFKEKVRERIERGRLTTPAGWEIDKVDLKGSYFPEKFPSNYFRERTFGKPILFVEATFSQGADFIGATFSQKADFSWAKFSQKADFYRATFSQGADFRVAKFSQEAGFNFATFSQGADFCQVKFMGRTTFQYILFSEEIIFQDVDLSRCSFLHSNIDKVDFRYCKFAKKKNRLFRITRVFIIRYIKALLGGIKPFFRMIQRCILAIPPFSRENVLRDELDCDEKGKAREGYEYVRRVYLELKRNFEDKKDWNTAGDFHFGEMECRRRMKGFLGAISLWKRFIAGQAATGKGQGGLF